MCIGIKRACPLGIFTSLEKAIEHSGKIGGALPMWIEKFVVDDPGFYEYEEDYVVWTNHVVSTAA